MREERPETGKIWSLVMLPTKGTLFFATKNIEETFFISARKNLQLPATVFPRAKKQAFLHGSCSFLNDDFEILNVNSHCLWKQSLLLAELRYKAIIS
mgnify:FL=1